MQASARFNAFGTPIVSPRDLSRLERIALLRKAAGSLQAGKIDGYTARWLGAALASWLETGQPLECVLGTNPEPGSRLTVAALTRLERQDVALLQFSNLVGGDRCALRILAGEKPCPSRALAALETLRLLDAPHSAAAFTRARRRSESSSPHRGRDDF